MKLKGIPCLFEWNDQERTVITEDEINLPIQREACFARVIGNTRVKAVMYSWLVKAIIQMLLLQQSG